MQATVQGITLLQELNSLSLDRACVDFWEVQSEAGAVGRYVSPHPRLVQFFDGAAMELARPGQEAGVSASVCYIPAEFPTFGVIGTARRLRHLDIHLQADRLVEILGPDAAMDRPHFLPQSPTVLKLGEMLAGECVRPARPAGYASALTEAIVHETFHLASTADNGVGWLAQVTRYVEDNLEEPICLGTLCSIAGMSRTQFSRRFREETGLPPYRWVKRARIARAQEMLQRGTPLAEAACAAGFADQAHFTRSFRDATGMTPGSWLAQYE
ncbi:AraC family transcriptional regulator [Pseudoruegeria sp. HB172150]|uniref:AraC family transcriptional regulator n=1 Tax=Pseudoruegeria sp. HB172150 TaxID=2721164 RepID=UPI001C12EAEE|nr:AraC family transcriptional regulator [Pseudoruegeria sp. HB172150]